MKQSSEAVRQYLEEDGRQFRIDDSKGVAHWRLWGRKGCFASTLRFYSEQELLVLILRYCHLVPLESRSAVVRLLTRVNHGLSQGTFEMSMEDGEVRLRLDLDHAGNELSSLMVRRLVHSATILGDRYLFPLLMVCYGQDDLSALSFLEGEA